ncbi:basic proline-rich protein-like [Lepus europaeus]|uniref:basic proline-rich protein-like n=1 Tax=Lepus europaeus TaxID=9983 RepID=UPI002B463E18|nr:basic proline-rich protein-like [Lepus europaeus]
MDRSPAVQRALAEPASQHRAGPRWPTQPQPRTRRAASRAARAGPSARASAGAAAPPRCDPPGPRGSCPASGITFQCGRPQGNGDSSPDSAGAPRPAWEPRRATAGGRGARGVRSRARNADARASPARGPRPGAHLPRRAARQRAGAGARESAPAGSAGPAPPPAGSTAASAVSPAAPRRSAPSPQRRSRRYPTSIFSRFKGKPDQLFRSRSGSAAPSPAAARGPGGLASPASSRAPLRPSRPSAPPAAARSARLPAPPAAAQRAPSPDVTGRGRAPPPRPPRGRARAARAPSPPRRGRRRSARARGHDRAAAPSCGRACGVPSAPGAGAIGKAARSALPAPASPGAVFGPLRFSPLRLPKLSPSHGLGSVSAPCLGGPGVAARPRRAPFTSVASSPASSRVLPTRERRPSCPLAAARACPPLCPRSRRPLGVATPPRPDPDPGLRVAEAVPLRS